MAWFKSKWNISPPFSLFYVLALHLDWSDVCMKQMADLQLQQCMPNSGSFLLSLT